MEHVVFFPAADDTPQFRRVPTLQDAVALVEQLRNVEGVQDVNVHALHEVPLSFKTYYRVEVPALLADSSGERPEPQDAPALVPAPLLVPDGPALALVGAHGSQHEGSDDASRHDARSDDARSDDAPSQAGQADGDQSSSQLDAPETDEPEFEQPPTLAPVAVLVPEQSDGSAVQSVAHVDELAPQPAAEDVVPAAEQPDDAPVSRRRVSASLGFFA